MASTQRMANGGILFLVFFYFDWGNIRRRTRVHAQRLGWAGAASHGDLNRSLEPHDGPGLWQVQARSLERRHAASPAIEKRRKEIKGKEKEKGWKRKKVKKKGIVLCMRSARMQFDACSFSLFFFEKQTTFAFFFFFF